MSGDRYQEALDWLPEAPVADNAKVHALLAICDRLDELTTLLAARVGGP